MKVATDGSVSSALHPADMTLPVLVSAVCVTALSEVDVIQHWPDQSGRQRLWRGAAAGFSLAATLTLLTVAGCGHGPSASPTPLTPAAAAIPTAGTMPEDYVIGAGRISTPLIGDIAAADNTPTQLARGIEKKLGKYIQDPNVTVIVRSFVGPADRQVRVIGEAAEPAAVPYRDHMSLLDVMIATKGLTKYASGNRALIVRLGPGGTRESIKVRFADLVKDGDISQNLEMRPGDTLIIPQSWF